MADSELDIVVRTRDEATPGLKRIESSIIRFVGAVSAALASIRVIALPVQQAAEFQAALLNVAKTTEFTDRQIDQLSKSLIELSKRLNVSALDLAKIAEIGGQLGVGAQGPEALAIFTESASRFSSVLEVSAEEAGNAIAKIANIFQINIREAERISSTLNELANNSTASGKDLIDIIQRIGTAGATVSFEQAAALAATGRDLGLTLETIGTSFNKIFLDLQTKAPEVAQLIGMPVEEFTATLRSDGIRALELYLDALSKLPTQQRAAIAEQITGGGRIFALVTSLVRQQEEAARKGGDGVSLLRRNLGFANKGYKEGTSAIREQERVLQGLLAQLQILKNVFFALGEQIGRQALPYLTDLVKKLQELGKDPEFVRRMNEFAAALGRNIKLVLDFAVAILSNEKALKLLIDTALLFGQIKLGLLFFNLGKNIVTSTANLLRFGKAFKDVATGAAAISEGRVQQGAKAIEFTKSQALAAQAAQTIFAPGPANRRAMESAYASINAHNAEIIAAERQITLIRKQAADEIRNERNLTRQRAQAAEQAGNRRSAQAIRRTGALSVAASLANVREEQAALVAANAVRQQTIQQQQVILRNAQALAPALTPVGRVTTLIGAGFRGIGTGLLRLGGLIGRVLLGPIGLIAITAVEILHAFGLLEPIVRTIGGWLGFGSEEEQKAAKEARDRATWMREQREQAAALGEEYDNNYDRISKINASTDGAAKGVLDYSKAWQQAAKEIELTKGKMTDLAFRSKEQEKTLRGVKDRAAEVAKELDNARRQLAGVQKSNEFKAATRIGGLSQDDKDAERRAADRVASLEAEAKALGAAQENIARRQKATAAEEAKLYNQRIEANVKLLGVYDEQGFALLQLQRQQIAATEEVKKLEAEAQALRKQGAGGIDAPEELNTQLAKVETNLEQARATATQTGAALEEGFRKATPAAAAFFQAVAPAGATSKLEELDNKLDTIANANGKRTQKQIADNEKVIKGLEEQASKLASSKFKEGAAKVYTEIGAGLAKAVPGLGAPLSKLFEDVGTRIRRNEQQRQRAIEDSANQYRTMAQVAIDGERAAEMAAVQSGEARKQQAIDVQRYYQGIIRAVTLEPLLIKQVAAQEKIAESAKNTADLAKAAYKNAQDDIVKTLQENARRLTEFYSREAQRASDQANARRSLVRDRQTRVAERATDRAFERERERIQRLGLGVQATQQMLDALEDQRAVITDMRKAESDRADAADKVASAQSRQATIIREIESAQQKIVALDKERTAATDPAKINELTAKIQVQLGTVERLTAEYEKQAGVVEEQGRRQFPSLGKLETAPIVSTDEVAKQQEKINQLQESAARLKTEVARTEADAAQRVATEEGSKLVTLQEQLKQVQSTIDIAAKSLGGEEAAKNLRLLGQALNSAIPGASELADKLRSIGDAGVNTDKFNTDIAALMTQVTAISAEIDTQAQQLVARATANGATSTRTLLQAVATEVQANPIQLTFGGNVKPEDAEKLRQSISDALTNIAFNPSVDGVSESLATELSSQTYKITVEADVKPASGTDSSLFEQLFQRRSAGGLLTVTPGIRGATGGYLRGPGTGISDSIPALLSNGEYVIDANTTSAFGPSFFSTLQSIARRGRGAMTRMLMPRIPRFAAGGPVLAPGLAGAGEAGSIDTMRVELNIGGKTIQVAAERRQAQELARTLKNLSRGV